MIYKDIGGIAKSDYLFYPYLLFELFTMSTKITRKRVKKPTKTKDEIFQEIMEKNQRIRKRATLKLNEILNDPDDQDLEEEIETCLYYYVADRAECKLEEVFENRKAVQLYHHFFTSLVLNLDPDSCVQNKNLRGKILSGEISPEDLITSSTPEWFPEKWEEIKKKKKAEEDFLYERRIVAKSDAYTCGKCKKAEVSYVELQTRSADEPMTLFITCLHCNHHWRMG